MSKTIGIDLGTTNSCVAVIEGDRIQVIENSQGQRTTPSVVAFSKNGERLVGDVAKRQAAVNVDRTISSIKRQMGTDYRKKIDGKDYTPQEISAMILMKLKKDAEAYLGESVTQAVITVPAYFNDAERQATKDAGKIAGLDVKRIINEPTAAALAYGLDNGQNQKVLVYDLGGGTFDVSIIEIGENLIEVLATAGDNHLGGDDFDECLAEYIVEEFKRKENVKLKKDATAMMRVTEEAEKAKKALSTAEIYQINLPFISTKKGEPVHLEMSISRAQFNNLTKHLVDRTEAAVHSALSDAGLKASEIDRVLLVGGSTRIPAVVDKVRKLMGKEPSRNINPDECVAMGAAVQGSKFTEMKSGELSVYNKARDMILMDGAPVSLWVETLGGVANVIIPRNTTIPTKQSKVYSTAANFQSSVEIKVYQGESKFVRDNKLLGNFRLNGIKKAMAGVPQIEVTFDIDVNGIVKVSAKDLGTGKEQEITISSSSNLSDEEIERARQDAIRYENEDGLRMEMLEIRNEAEQYLNMVESKWNDSKTGIDKANKKQIKADMDYLRKLLAKAQPDKMTEIQAGEIKDARYKLEQSAAVLWV